jgi:hypothetical protein
MGAKARKYNEETRGLFELLQRMILENPHMLKIYADSIINDVEDNITASAIATQVSGFLLEKAFNNVTTVASSGNSLTLTSGGLGKTITVRNKGANPAAIFPNSGGNINGGTTDAPILIYPNQVISLTAVSNLTWVFNSAVAADIISELTANTGVTIDGVLIKDGGITSVIPNIYDHNTGIIAFPTGGQGNAVALTGEYNNINVCATAGDSVKLPTAVLGQSVVVTNNGVAALDVFPFSGDTIDSMAANLALRVPPGVTITFKSISAVAWYSNYGQGVFTKSVTLTAVEIVGNAAGALAHADGSILVPSAGAGYVNQFLSAVLIYKRVVADYTGGGDNLVVNVGVSGTQVAHTVAVAKVDLLLASVNKIAQVSEISATDQALTILGANVISLFAGTAYTQPGTAAGTLTCVVTYKLIKTGL